jgi:tetratricopeptide (TPR) repeat protein
MAIDAARAKSLFLNASDLADPVERAAYLERECGGDAELRGRVEALLRANDAAPLPPAASADATVDSGARDQDLDVTGTHTPQPDNSTTSDYRPQIEPGLVIASRYTLVQKIGEGGMGEVWVARQTEPVKRKVALKLIKTGMDSRAVVARFEQERQALAMMDHPNIARVLDGGMTPTGQPFFVMELVNGLPLMKFCDEARLTPRQRLELFVPICQAVQHAHQKGIVHRDLKPANILITLIDARPVPKVIDFGVAKAIAGKLTDESMSTQFGAIVGTLEYMSPEQAGFSGDDIDTRSDIYSLGVILYELLTGLRPLDARHLKKAVLTEMLRLIREEEPSKPSTRLSTDESLPSLAALRQTEPRKLMALLRGELDWVVLKCLEKQRERRYETANGLARDIQRYLADEVVEARPPSAGYRLKKFVRRHKGQVIAAGLILFILLAGIAGTTGGLIRAKQQELVAIKAAENERQAKVHEAEKAEGERQAKLDAEARQQEAERNLAFAKKGNAILGSVFAGLEPKKIAESGRPLQDFLRENLKQAVRDLDGAAIGDPLEVAEMQLTLGQSLLGLGEFKLAIEVIQKALETRSTKLGPDHLNTLACMSLLAVAYRADGNVLKALALDKETLALTKAKLGPDDPSTLISMNNLAAGYRAAGKQNEALELLGEVFERTKGRFGVDDPLTLVSMHNLAVAYWDAGKLEKALPLLEEEFELTKARLGVDHPNTLTSMGTLGMFYIDAKKLDKALPWLEETFKRMTAKLGPDHPSTLTAMNNLAEGYRDAEKLDRALPMFEEALRLTRIKLGSDHPNTLTTMNNLADAYRDAGNLDRALPLYEETLTLSKAKLGPDHPSTLTTMNNLALGYREAGKLDLALPLQEEALKLMKAKLGPDHPDTLNCLGNLGKAYFQSGQGEKAAATLTEFIAGMRKLRGNDSSKIAGLLAKVSQDLLSCGQHVAAESMLRELLAVRATREPDVWTTFCTQSQLGGALLGQKKYIDAEPLLLKGYEGMKQREKTIPPVGKPRIPEALDRLIKFYTATDKPDEVKKWRAERAKYPPEKK